MSPSGPGARPAARACRHQFACFAAASPAAVWSALTEPSQTRAYLYGLAAHSSWQADAPIQFRFAGRCPIIGQVLHVEAPRRLSYVLQAGPGDPPVYLTWQIRPSPGGSTIWLHIDETDFADNDEEAENTWLPVLAALQDLLAAGTRTSPDTRTGKRPAPLGRRIPTAQCCAKPSH
jgi:uncharacterized protein YndB with AHSA1/START domain